MEDDHIEDYVYTAAIGEYDGNESYYEFPEYIESTVAEYIYAYVFPVFLSVATIGNALCFLVMLQLCRQVWSTCVYLALVAVIDLVVLYTRCGNDWMVHKYQLDFSNMLMTYSDSICKAYPFTFNLLLQLGRWLLVATAVEGMIAMRHAHIAHNMCTLSRARAVVLLLIVLLICINSHYFWTFELVKQADLLQPQYQVMCTFSKHGHQYSEEFVEYIWPVTNILVTEIAPMVLILGCGIAMLVQLLRGRHRGDTHHQAWQARYILYPEVKDQLKVTFTVLACTYPILLLPKFTTGIFQDITRNYEPADPIGWFYKVELAAVVGDSLEYMLLSTKLLLYVATCRQFRKQLIAMFKCCCAQPSPNGHNQQDNLLGRPELTSSKILTF